MAETTLRIGQGYDVHRLIEGRKLILGGVTIPWARGLLGHSDADVLIHAIMDALLGAAGMGDIGRLFPDSDPQYAGVSSLSLLQQVVTCLNASGYQPVNIDATVIAQAPKLAPFIPDMQKNLAQCLCLPMEQVNVKATTEERLGFTGAEEGIAAQAIALLERHTS